MPRSWLMPAVAVHRSALPVMMANEFWVGASVSESRVASRSRQLVPSLPVSRYCWVLAAVTLSIGGRGGSVAYYGPTKTRGYPPSSSVYIDVLVLQAVQPPARWVVPTPLLFVMPSAFASVYVVWPALPAPNITAWTPAAWRAGTWPRRISARLSW